MRLIAVLVACSGLLAAQSSASGPALIRGVLLERDPQSVTGEISVRGPDNQVFRYLFDRKTYVERENQLIDVRRLEPGDKVEVVSDVVSASALRYARTIHVLADETARPRPPRRRPLRDSAADRTLPTGNLTYAGVVSRVSSERLVLRTREGGEETLLLRKDTRYLQNGEMVEHADLKPNMRVFIRAGKDLYGEVEAYQVIWGKILGAN